MPLAGVFIASIAINNVAKYKKTGRRTYALRPVSNL